MKTMHAGIFTVLMTFMCRGQAPSEALAASCATEHGGSIEFFTDHDTRGEGLVGFIHQNDPPFNTRINKQLEPGLLLDPDRFAGVTHTSTAFAGAYATTPVPGSLGLSGGTLALSSLDLAAFPTNQGVSWPTFTGKAKHIIVVQRKVVRPSYPAGASWSDIRDYVLQNFEYRLVGGAGAAADTGFDAVYDGTLKDQHGKEFAIRVHTMVQETGVNTTKCNPVDTSGTTGYAIYLYPEFEILGDSLDTEAEVGALHNPRLPAGYRGEVTLFRKRP